MHGTSTGPVLHVANSPGTVGTFLRVQQDIGGCGARWAVGGGVRSKELILLRPIL